MRFAYFFKDGEGVDAALSLYRRNYRPSQHHPKPQPTICVWALGADTEAEARRLLTAREHWRVGFEKGLREPLVSPEHAAAYEYTPAERAIIAGQREVALVGTAPALAAELTRLAERLALDEVVINTWTFDPAARRHSYALLARALGLDEVKS